MILSSTALIATSDIRLIIISILIAIIGSCTALDIAEPITIPQAPFRHWWLVGSGLTLGITIWAMHFTAILSLKLLIPVGYDFTIVIISMLVAIVASIAGLFVISLQERPKWLLLSTASIFIGSGIVGMHFIAMSAMRLAAKPSYDLKFVILSHVIAIAFSLVALWLMFQPRIDLIRSEVIRKVGSAIILGIAICGMHYIAMAGVRFFPEQLNLSKFSVIDNSVLAVTISIAALLVLTLALLAAFFGRRFSAQLARTEALCQSEERLEQLVKQRTAELEAQKLISEVANQAKSDFLSNMSHELRTPLTSIIGFTSVLQEQIFGTLNDKQLKYITVIATCGDQLLALINDLLDLSKIEAGTEELELETLLVKDICQECITLIRQQANSKDLQLLLFIETDSTTCIADELRLKQILLNLLSNAVKFTEAGSVTLTVNQEKDSIQFAVSDTGIGISKKDQATLFQPFQQVDSSSNRKYKGTGLGLALARKLALLHGGDITLESELGHGSCFTLFLPKPPLKFEDDQAN